MRTRTFLRIMRQVRAGGRIDMRHKQARVVVVVVMLMVGLGFGQTKKAAKAAGGGPDKALMQKVWDGWSTLEVSNVSEFYATGPHVFFDIAPLKYASWD